MSDLSKHTLTVNITDRIDWIDKRCSLTDIQKDYIASQMKDAVLDALTQANDVETKSSGLNLHHVSNNESEAEVACCGNCHLPLDNIEYVPKVQIADKKHNP